MEYSMQKSWSMVFCFITAIISFIVIILEPDHFDDRTNAAPTGACICLHLFGG